MFPHQPLPCSRIWKRFGYRRSRVPAESGVLCSQRLFSISIRNSDARVGLRSSLFNVERIMLHYWLPNVGYRGRSNLWQFVTVGEVSNLLPVGYLVLKTFIVFLVISVYQFGALLDVIFFLFQNLPRFLSKSDGGLHRKQLPVRLLFTTRHKPRVAVKMR